MSLLPFWALNVVVVLLKLNEGLTGFAQHEGE